MAENNLEPNPKKDASIVVNDIRIQATDRNKKDIQGWRNSHRSAESPTNPNRSRLYDLYADILLDGHLSGIIQKRIDAILNKELCYYAPDGKKVDGMDKMLHSAAFREIKLLIMETLLWGVSGIEFTPGKELSIYRIPRKHIKPEKHLITFEQNGTEGVDYTRESSIWVLDTKDLGLLLKCSPYVIYKRDIMADWSNYAEIFGQPVRIIKYDAYDEQTRIELKQVLDESGSSLALMIPKQADFELKDGKQSNGDGQLQERFKNSLNQELSIIILGNTETTTNGQTGSQAKSKVHEDQQKEIAKSDLSFTLNSLNDAKLHAILKSYGWPVVEGGYFDAIKTIDINYLKDRKEIDEWASTKVPIDDDYIYETYGIPKPANYEVAKKEMQQKQQAQAKAKAQEKEQEDDNAEEPEDLAAPPPKGHRWKRLMAELSYFFALAPRRRGRHQD